MTVVAGNIVFNPAVNCGVSIVPVCALKLCGHVSASNRYTTTLYPKSCPVRLYLHPSAFPLCWLCQCSSKAEAPAAIPLLTLPQSTQFHPEWRSTPRQSSHLHAERKDRATEKQRCKQVQQWLCMTAGCQEKQTRTWPPHGLLEPAQTQLLASC